MFSTGDIIVTSKSFKGDDSEYLNYEKGTVLTVVEYKKYRDLNLVYCKNQLNQCGFVEVEECIKREELELHKMKFFFGLISRTKSEEILKPTEEGTFLVRESIKFLGDYSLSIRYTEGKTAVQHYRIVIKNGQYSIDNETFFENVINMIDYYQQSDDGLCCCLKTPLKIEDKMNISSNVYRQTFKKFGWEIPLSAIEKTKEIGKGEFGAVHLGNYQNRKVAVKSLIDSSAQVKQFLSEISIMTVLKHQNLIELLGISFEKSTFYIVMEFCEMGDLANYVRSRGRMIVNPLELINYSKQICDGMEYVEMKNVVHRDLAARNVLLNNQKIVKITDFGLAVLPNENVGNAKFPLKWTAIEAILYARFTSKSDVWSYGVLLWELFSYGKNPYPRKTLDEVIEFVKNGGRMEIPDGTPLFMYKIMLQCWTADPIFRPSFKQIQSMFKNALQTNSF